MYVTNDSGFVYVIDTTTNTVIDTNPNLPGINPIPVGFTTFGIAYDPINQDMYVTDIDGSSVYVIDTTTNTVIDTNPNLPGINPIPVGFQPRSLAYDPVNERMYVTLGVPSVSVIDTTTNTVIDTNPNLPGINPIPTIPNAPIDIAYDLVNKRMYDNWW